MERVMSVWSEPLPFPIVPKSGPMRSMQRLSQVNRALTKDLPFRLLCQPRWQHAARLVIQATATGRADDIQSAYDGMIDALDSEGWMTAEPVRLRFAAFSGRATHLLSSLESFAGPEALSAGMVNE
jgi:hypothetical protein